jgi:hypothetical protein
MTSQLIRGLPQRNPTVLVSFCLFLGVAVYETSINLDLDLANIDSEAQGRDDEGLTDAYSDVPLPKKSRTGLVRSYAMALISDTRPTVKNNCDGYKPDIEQEMVMGSEYEDDDKEDDSETLKKKKKADKPKVRDLIKAQYPIPQDLQEALAVNVTILSIPHNTHVLV